jgi:hypothetical protein
LHAYYTFAEMAELGRRHGLKVVDAFTPAGATLGEQLDQLLSLLAGTDQEGTVLAIEHGPRLVYRVKCKSPDYLRLMKLMVHCTYLATVEMLDSFASLPSWSEFEAFLRTQGTDKVPEEVLGLYKEHYDAFIAYRERCETLMKWAMAKCAEVKGMIVNSGDARVIRKEFAERVKVLPHSGLLFCALDGRLDLARVRQFASSPQEVDEAVDRIKGSATTYPTSRFSRQ